MRKRMRSSIILFLTVVGAGTAILVAQAKFSDFGINEAQLKSRIVSALIRGNVPEYSNAKAYHAATPAIQAAFVKNSMAWLKWYTESSAFQSDYNQKRAAAKPAGPESKGSADDQYSKMLADQRKQLEETKKNVAAMSPDMQKQMAPALKQMEASIEQMAKNPQMASMLKQGLAGQDAQNQKRYQDELAKYDKDYPADPKVLIASRLRQFLEVSKDVNFNAKLVPIGGGRMDFADQQYRQKSADWKLCYRAGEPAVQAARSFATEWLKQLGKG
jgi:hypothetical protein